jgi:hypothetical protein
MKKPSPTIGFGPGWTRQDYLDQLAAPGYTGYCDDDGAPRPWPEDFVDPNSGWQPAEGDTTSTSNPGFAF